VWLTNTVGYDGYRLDFVRGFQESYAAAWINALPKKNGRQRFVVGEYWGAAGRIEGWVKALAAGGADADGFDFPLKGTLTSMANGDDSWDMRWLNHAGLVRNEQGHSLPGTSVVTFVENHDTGKEHDKWVKKDWDMAYAYILFAEGRPCVFYSHFYGVPQQDAHDHSHTVTAPASLKDDLKRLIHARKTYLGGTMAVLSEVGHPWPEGGAHNVYVARRQGNGAKSGAVLVINNHGSEAKGLWVDHAPGPGFVSWGNKTLVNAFDPSSTTKVFADGRVHVSAPPRGYAIYVPQDEFVAY
jgi:alpha-amylase